MLLLNSILEIKRFYKQLLVISIDIIISFFSIFFTFYILISESILSMPNENFIFILIITIFFIPFFVVFGLYNTIFSFSDNKYILNIFFASVCYFIIFYILFYLVFTSKMPTLTSSPSILHPIIFFTFIFSSRIFILIIVPIIKDYNISKINILIYGVSNSLEFYKQLLNQFNIIGFIDDDNSNVGKRINNIKIYNFDKIEEIVKKNNIQIIYLAINLNKSNKRKLIISKLENLKISIRSFKKNDNKNFYDFKISDILIRNIDQNINLIQSSLIKKSVLITGAGGSIGSEISKQIIYFKIKQLIILDHSEYLLFTIYKKLEELIKKNKINCKIVPIVLSVLDKDKLEDIFVNYQPKIIFHSAAYKHVDLMEKNYYSVINNNIFGSVNIIDISLKHNVESFTLISSDKAVRPTSIMGKSKRISEMYLQSIQANIINEKNKSIFSIVRFGNVLGSSGSVIPIFKNQIFNGGPISVTDPKVNRYFMLIPEAANLVLQTLFLSEGGDVFILNMGEPVMIKELAERMIRLNGFIPTYDFPKNKFEIQIIFSGLSKGEKLCEELLTGNNPMKTLNPDIFKTFESYPSKDLFNIFFHDLKTNMQKNDLIMIDRIAIDFLKKNDRFY